MIRRFVIAVLLIAVSVALWAAGEQEAPEAAAEEPIPVRYVVPGTEPTDSPMIDEAISTLLQEDGLLFEFSRQWIAWDVWQQKTNVMISSGEPFELLQIMEDWIPSSNYVANGGLVPIDEYIEEHGDVLRQVITPDIWETVKIDGQTYTIPVQFRDFSAQENLATVQEQYYDKYDIPLPETLDELVQSAGTIVENENDPDLGVWEKINTDNPLPYFMELDTWPFTIKEDLILVRQDGTVEPWLYSEEFKHGADVHNRLYESGVINPDFLIIPWEESSRHRENGDWVFHPKLSRLQEDVKPEAVLTTVRFAPEKRNFRRLAIMNANAVPVTSETPSAGVQFFNWLYSSQEYYNLLNFGIEGEHWEDIGDRRYRALVEPTEYSFGDWMMGNHTLAKVDEHMPDRNLPFFLGWDEDAVSSVAIGFTFDPEPVSAEWTACKAEIEATVYPLKFGVISYDEGFEDMRAKMDAAGYERVVEEWNKQFQAWLATR